MLERLLCMALGMFLGVLAGSFVALFYAGIMWCGYSISWGEFAPFELFRQMFGMAFSMLALLGGLIGTAFGANSY